jgi:hypothetical protein
MNTIFILMIGRNMTYINKIIIKLNSYLFMCNLNRSEAVNNSSSGNNNNKNNNDHNSVHILKYLTKAKLIIILSTKITR